MNQTLRAGLVVVAVFAAGAVSGFAAHSVAHERHGPPHARPPHLRELDLTPVQEEQAHAIFERHRVDLEAIMRESLPRARARTEQMEQELRTILTDDQAKHLDEIRRHRPPPPPPFFGAGGPPPPPPGPPRDPPP